MRDIDSGESETLVEPFLGGGGQLTLDAGQ